MKEIAWKKICCPVDFSEESRAALRVAADVARRLGADLLRRGAPGVHFYTLNRSTSTRAILAALRASEPWRG